MIKYTRLLAEKALHYIRFHKTPYGNGFSFDADKYAEEVLSQALKKAKKPTLTKAKYSSKKK